jgi:hypothetical protein
MKLKQSLSFFGGILLSTFAYGQCNLVTTLIPQSFDCSSSCECAGSLEFSYSNIGTPDSPYSVKLYDSDGVLLSEQIYNLESETILFTNLCEDSYQVIIEGTSCSDNLYANVSMAPPLDISAIVTNASPGNSDGQISMAALGGTPPYEFSLDNQMTWQSSGLFTNLTVDSYIVWVQDANGCAAPYTVLVSESTAVCNFNLLANGSSSVCGVLCNESISYSFSEGVDNSPYTIDLMQGTTVLQSNMVFSGSFGSGIFTNLCEGSYQVRITDANGCSNAETVDVFQSNTMSLAFFDNGAATVGLNDGWLEAIVTGGLSPYIYTIDGGLVMQFDNGYFGNLYEGCYELWAEDANGCVDTFLLCVNPPGCDISTSLTHIAEVGCPGDCLGELNYAYTDASSNPPYTLSISMDGIALPIFETTQMSNTFSGNLTGLCAGTYNLSVTNGNGCSATANTSLLDLPFMDAFATVTEISLGASDGTVQIDAYGGGGSYTYSINGVDYQASNFFENLAVGTYTAYVKDLYNCLFELIFTITEGISCSTVLSAIPSNQNYCACEESISFAFNDAGNSTNYTVELYNDLGIVIDELVFTCGAATGVFDSLCSGVYTLTLTDDNACVSSEIITLTLSSIDIITSIVQPTVGNSDGSVTLTVTGGEAPYQFSTDNVTWQLSGTFNNLSAGDYTFFVQDANGCVQLITLTLADSNLSVGDMSVTQNVLIYPNPTQGLVFVEAANLQNALVFDLSGKSVVVTCSLAAQGLTIDFTNTVSGVYIVEFISDNGNVTRAFVIKN